MSGHHAMILAKYLAKLERRNPLPAEEKAAFLGLPHSEQNFPAHQNIVKEGSRINDCIFVGSGLLSRMKTIGDGRRQIVAFNIPGDAADLQSLLLKVADHSIYTHTLANIATVSHASIRSLIPSCPVLAEALWLDTLIEASIFREWTVNVGQRKAIARIAHLLLEMEVRFASIGQCDGGYVLPLTQTEISEALGLSLVHLNKSLQQLRRKEFIELKGHRLSILDREAMQQLSGFNQLYLHLRPADSEAPMQGDVADVDRRSVLAAAVHRGSGA